MTFWNDPLRTEKNRRTEEPEPEEPKNHIIKDFKMVREGGLEPPHLSAYAPQTYVATITPPAHFLLFLTKGGPSVNKNSLLPG